MWIDNIDWSGFIVGFNSGSVNTGTLGTYIVSYEYSDSAGNVGTGVSRTINVIDTIVPVANISYSTILTTSGVVTVSLTGISEPIIITNNSGSNNFTFGANGSFTFTYRDAGLNTWSTTATVNNIDTTPPIITLISNSSVTVYKDSIYRDSWATALDNVSGNITNSITSSGNVNTGMTWTYTILFNVTDGVGNMAIPVMRTIYVVASPPIVSLPSSWWGGSSASYVGTTMNYSSNSSSNQITSSMTLGIVALQKNLDGSFLISKKWETSIDNTQELFLKNSTPAVIIKKISFAEDITDSSSQKEIITLIKKWVINNTKKFYPQKNMTRAEFIKIVSLLYNFQELKNTQLYFSDISKRSEFRKYITFAVVMGWVNSEQKTFRPNDPITLGEAQKVLTIAKDQGSFYGEVTSTKTITREEWVRMIVQELDL